MSRSIDESFDLVEHRHVRGVGGVAAEHPARARRCRSAAGWSSIVRICTGDVCVRSTVVPSRPSGGRGRRTACRTRCAPGGPSAMLSASKLCQSVSTSGPSATWKPSPMNTSSSRSQAWVTRCAWPRVGRADELGEVEAFGLDPRVERFVAEQSSGDPRGPRRRRTIASLIAWPAAFFSSIESSEPSRVFSWARSPFLPVSREVSSLTSSSVDAESIAARAASRAAVMSEST